tara:strand:+ start:299 stop:478 length:180 start_codon:yes stop_codon:yes gene_type:complete
VKEKIKEWLQKIFQKKHNDSIIKDRVQPEGKDEHPDYRYGDFRDEIVDVERIRRLRDGQ